MPNPAIISAPHKIIFSIDCRHLPPFFGEREDRRARDHRISRGRIGTTDRDEPTGWQFSKARGELALRLKPIIEAKASENLKTAQSGILGGAPLPTSAKAVDTREELAELAGVSHGTLAKAEALRTKARKGEASGPCVLQKTGERPGKHTWPKCWKARQCYVSELQKKPKS
jgi:hypothetical protein